MKHNISIFFLVFTSYCLQISQQKLFLATIDTGKEELNKNGKDYQEVPEYIDDCSDSATKDSVLSDPVS